MYSVRTKILAALISLVTLAVLIAGLIAYHLSSDAISELRRANLNMAARQTSLMVRAMVDATANAFTDLASEEILEVYTRKHQHPLLLKHFLDHGRTFHEAVYIDPRGEPVLFVAQGALADPADGAFMLRDGPRAGERPEALVVQNREGEGSLLRFEVSPRNFFDENLGTVVADYSFEGLAGILDAVSARGRDYSLLLDRDGRVIASGRIREAPGLDFGPSGDKALKLPDVNSGITELTLGGHAYMAAFAPMAELGLTVAVLTPRSLFYKERTLLRNSLLAVFAGLALAAVLVAFWLAARIAAPLARMTGAALKVANRDLSVRIPEPEGHDEISDLTRAFNAMVDKLRAAMAWLEEARSQADTANRAKSDFLARMSHELRTPLNAITGMTDVALQTRLKPEQRDCLETVRDSAFHLTGIVNDILDFTRIEANKLKLVPVHFDLRESLKATVRMLGYQASAKGISLGLDMDPGLPACVLGDAARLRQILINLTGNAIKYTDAGGVKVAARAESAGEDRIRLLFSVKDTGRGIAPEDMGRLFEAFSQGGQADPDRPQGTGLGLAISKQLVDMMGGRIEVHSVPGQGSEFAFSVLLRAGDPAKVRHVPSRAKAARSKDAPALRVLVAEDNPVNAEVARMFLLKAGHVPVLAVNGLEAISELAAEPCDLVLMDLEMPMLGGLEAARRIRAGEAGEKAKNVPIVAITAHALTEHLEACLEAGMNDFLPKPITFAKLVEVVDQAMNGGAPAIPDQDRPQNNGTEVLDWNGALDRLDGDLDLYAMSCRFFLENSDRQMQGIHGAVAGNDLRNAALLAHAFTNTAGTIGALEVKGLAQALENAAGNGDGRSASALAGKLEQALKDAELAIRDRLKNSRPD